MLVVLCESMSVDGCGFSIVCIYRHIRYVKTGRELQDSVKL